jgi:hypothetical protein
MSTSEQKNNPNEAREVSILKRNLRLLKRVALGKQAPPMFLKVLCWIFLAWDLLMIIAYVFIGISGSILDVFDSSAGEVDELTPKYFFTYALLHAISLLGVILMYRRRLTGFYLFLAANLAMPFWVYIITRHWKFELWIFLFSVVSIALFAINWNKFKANIKKKEKKAAEEAQNPQGQVE